MAVSGDDVRHVAALARLGVDDARLPAIAEELSGILGHMDALSRIDTTGVEPVTGIGAAGTPLRRDRGDQFPLAVPREAFAPATRDGFFLVPRLATHASAAEPGGPGESEESA
jgi:aspartyl-tRNA(Asn)/glutamyl-tRNA(Gln) amidotransferase subunit C